MKIFITFCLLFLLINIRLSAQERFFPIERYKGKLALTPQEISQKPVLLADFQLQEMLSAEQYKNYNIARNCYIASIPLYVISGCWFAFSGFWIGAGIHFLSISDGMGIGISLTLAFCTSIAASFTLVPAIILHQTGKNRLQDIAAAYNAQYKIGHQPDLKLDFGLTSGGVGLRLQF